MGDYCTSKRSTGTSYDILKKKLQQEKRIDRVLVIGSPGIGKSVFGVFLLLLFMSEHRNVAYRPLDYGTSPFYFWNSANNCYEASLKPISGNRYEGLFDGNESGALWARPQIFMHSCLFASPRTKNYNEQDCAKIYMNPWTKDECQMYVDALELEDQDEWFTRYSLVGGKPRLLFSVSDSLDTLKQG